jgi:hypothetical protein
MLLLLTLNGCSAPKRPAELPARDAIIGAHNTRIGAVDRLWSRVSVRVEGRDAEGSKFGEQGEGHLQVQRPDRVAVTVGKLGEVYFALGSNEDRYWLIDVSDSDRRVMVSGDRSLATPAKAAALGLPVHPRDIPVLLGLEPLVDAVVMGPTWDDDDRAVLRVPTPWGSAALRYDPRSLELVGSTAFDADGTVLADATLGFHGPVVNANGVLTVGRLPQRVEIRVPGFDGFVRMQLGEPRVRDINAAVFDPDRLARIYRVGEWIDLDAEAPPPIDDLAGTKATEGTDG